MPILFATMHVGVIARIVHLNKITIMITREFLLEKGFERDKCSPASIEDYILKVKPYGGYISIRFQNGNTNAVGLYIYHKKDDNTDIRKIVLNDTDITIRDFEIAKEVCRL